MKEIRSDLGLTQSDFARSLGLSQNFISGVESGNKSLSEPIVLLVRYRYGINDDWLVTSKGPKYAEREKALTGIIQLSEKSPIYQMMRQLERIYNEGDRAKMDAIRAQLKAFDPGERDISISAVFKEEEQAGKKTS
ncbi:MAG: helix-turn-helix domain-containing protein [Nitrospirae bacterium]|nr:helix-turn-helix domain-containing protein [Nitrospirota bacterium]